MSIEKLRSKWSKYNIQISRLCEEIEGLNRLANKVENNSKLLIAKQEYVSILENIKNITNEVNSIETTMNVVVFGKFKSGKSAFINVLLGKQLAPVNELEMNFSLNQITYGELEEAKIFYKNGNIETQSIDKTNKFLIDNRESETLADSIIRIEYTFPYQELNNIKLWDTPGFGSMTLANAERAMSLINDADIVLWIVDQDAIGASEDKAIIDKINLHSKPIVCIVNKMDKIPNNPETQSRFKDYIEKIYSNSFAKVFFCSSKNYELAESNGIKEIRNFLEKSIYSQKKQIVALSRINNIANSYQNILNNLEGIREKINSEITLYNDFNKETIEKIQKHTSVVKSEIDIFIKNVLYEEEYKYLITLIESGQLEDNSKISQLITKELSSAHRKDQYLKDLEFRINEALKQQWHNSINQVTDNLSVAEKYFTISQNELLNRFYSHDLVTTQLSNSINKEFTYGASGSVAGMLAAILGGGGFADVLLTGGLGAIGGIFLSGYLGKEKENSKQKSRIGLRDIIEDEKNRFQKEVEIKLLPKIDQVNSIIKEKLLANSEKLFFEYGDHKTNHRISNLLAEYLNKSDEFSKELDLFKEHIGKSEIFVEKTDHSDFIIFRENPNDGIEKLQNLFSTASSFIDFVDPYFQENSLHIIKNINTHIPIRVLMYYLDELTDQHSNFLIRLKAIREEKKSSLKVKLIRYKHQKGTPLHDRFIFSSNWGIQLGNGLDAIGKKDISVIHLKDHKEFKNAVFDKYWYATKIKFEEKEKEIIKIDL